MFGIGWSELLVIVLAFLVFVGPKELPVVMQRFGKLMRELSAASRELRNQLDAELREMPKPTDLTDAVTREVEELVSGPYAEARELDEQLKREMALEEATAPRFEPTPGTVPALPPAEKLEAPAAVASAEPNVKPLSGTGGHAG